MAAAPVVPPPVRRSSDGDGDLLVMGRQVGDKAWRSLSRVSLPPLLAHGGVEGVEVAAVEDRWLRVPSSAMVKDDGFGTSICALGDVNSDGFPDVLVGAPKAVNGSIRLLFGADVAGASFMHAWSLNLHPEPGSAGAFQPELVDADDLFGSSIALIRAARTMHNVTDVTLAIGAPNTRGMEGGSMRSGAVHILGLRCENSQFHVNVTSHSRFRFNSDWLSVRTVAPNASSPGPPHAPWESISLPEEAYFGASIASFGDVAGDGSAILAVGAPVLEPLQSGAVFFFRVPLSPLQSSTPEVLAALPPAQGPLNDVSSKFGYSLAILLPCEIGPGNQWPSPSSDSLLFVSAPNLDYTGKQAGIVGYRLGFADLHTGAPVPVSLPLNGGDGSKGAYIHVEDMSDHDAASTVAARQHWRWRRRLEVSNVEEIGEVTALPHSRFGFSLTLDTCLNTSRVDDQAVTLLVAAPFEDPGDGLLGPYGDDPRLPSDTPGNTGGLYRIALSYALASSTPQAPSVAPASSPVATSYSTAAWARIILGPTVGALLLFAACVWNTRKWSTCLRRRRLGSSRQRRQRQRGGTGARGAWNPLGR